MVIGRFDDDGRDFVIGGIEDLVIVGCGFCDGEEDYHSMSEPPPRRFCRAGIRRPRRIPS